MNLAKNKKMIFVILIFYLIISMLSIYSVKQSNYSYLTKQFMWYMVGFIIIFLSRKIKFKELIKYSLLFYVIGNILLIFLLLFNWGIYGYLLAMCIGNAVAVLIMFFGAKLFSHPHAFRELPYPHTFQRK